MLASLYVDKVGGYVNMYIVINVDVPLSNTISLLGLISY